MRENRAYASQTESNVPIFYQHRPCMIKRELKGEGGLRDADFRLLSLQTF
jgi:hypothetical protein